MNQPTPQQTEDAIFSGCIPREYLWWKNFHRDWEYSDGTGAPDDWVWIVTADHSTLDTLVSCEIRHADIIEAAREIASGQVEAARCVREQARALLHTPEDTDIDSIVADDILQVAVYGRIVF
ncbi:hypothetical protein OG225_43135 (plasmid) [Nocardia sp. NBC_01377]|uniref:hypothetical protein n=1 Tax=Nocardia sp. NBC_01377 TaxID=2903595 RepID=UPI002F90F175